MHDWNVTVEEAIEIQQRLRYQIQPVNSFELGDIKTVAGVDASFQENQGKAAAVLFSWPDMQILEQAVAIKEVTFPYVPGLFSFRELPLIQAALENLSTMPDLIMTDSQGYAHPRRMGLACHLGLVLDRPTIGCAKTRLIGDYDQPGNNIGDQTLLIDEGETIGIALRTQPNSKPIFVSIGHKIDLPTAVDFVLKSLKGFRLPETTRMADIVAA